MVEKINGSDNWARESARARRQLEDAERHLRAGDFTAAQDACRELLAVHAEHLGALYMLGRACMAQGNYDSALPCFFRASMLSPREPAILAGLAEVYCLLQADEAALETAQNALDLEPDEETAADAHLVSGRVLERMSDYGRATGHLEKALALNPDLRTAALLLGACHMEQGNREGAARAYKAALEGGVPPLDRSQIHYDLAQRPKAGDAKKILLQIDALKKETSALETPLHDAFFQGRLELARARIFEGLGRHADALRALEAGNAPLRVGYSEANRALNGQIEPTIERARGWKYDGPCGAVNDKDIPVTLLILGPLRSGKSTLERLTGSMAGVTLGFESGLVQASVAHVSSSARLLTLQFPGQLPESLYDEFSRFYASELAQRANGKKLFTTTHPGLIPDLGRVAELVPNVRIVFIGRDTDDMAYRILGKMYRQNTNPFAYDVANIDKYLDGHARLAEAWSEHLGDISLRVSYEDMVADPKGTLANVAKLAGLPVPKGKLPGIGDDRGCAEPYQDFLNKARE